MEKQKLQPFTIISSPDDKFKVWIRRPVSDGRIVCTCGFSLEGRMAFVDAINKLPYTSVETSNNIDEDMSHIILRVEDNKNAVRLIEDLPELMEQYLINV
jgi:hypothetical protein